MLNAPGARAAGPADRGLEGLLAGRSVAHARWGLERIRHVLGALGNPERTFRSLHFGGTNGKGSAAATAYAVLEAAGRPAGLYTSPHLRDVRERIRAPGGPEPELLDTCADRVRPAADEAGATYFEVLTAVAFLAFAETGVAWAAVEAGLGGRLDATNVLWPAACGMTSISLDHTVHLGRTLAEIAREKAGILKPGVPAALGRLPAPALRVIADRAAEVGAPLLRVGRDARVGRVETTRAGTSFTYRSRRHPRGLPLRTPLPGEHQARNAALAVLALEEAAPSLSEGAIRAGVAATRIAGRFQVLEADGRTWVLDIAHNPEAVRALRRTLDAVPLPRPLVHLVGILRDKPARRMLDLLVAEDEAVVLTVPPGAPPERVGGTAALPPEAGRREVIPAFDRAASRARELAGAGTVVVSGSAYTVGEMLGRLGT